MPHALGNPHNIITGKNFRITVIAERFIRFEWNPTDFFEDRQTLAVINRDLGEVDFEVSRDGSQVKIDTGKLNIAVTEDGEIFSAANLAVSFDLNGKTVSWHPGDLDTGNLKGTCRTLDNCEADINLKTGKITIDNGFISRDGWSVIDDSTGVVLDENSVYGEWAAARPEGEKQDFYLLAYGHDYLAALAEAAEVFGRQPLIPRYALGYWFSRYWAYSDTEIARLIDDFDAAKIPVDVMIMDMDWHLPGWTGNSWDKRYFPEPEVFLQELHRRGLHTALNLHPADGVNSREEQFPAMARAMGVDPEKCDKIHFDVSDPEYMKNYFQLLHHPHEDIGVDFWWMDYQQNEETAVAGLVVTPWINHLHWTDMAVRTPEKRPLIFSRFGGVGAGRYAVGFSGDTVSTFASLKYQIGFTARSANILYGYWSHDLGGHMLGNLTPELYLRWLQFGMLSPVMRTHGSKYSPDRAFFAQQHPFPRLLGDVVRRRYEFVPYIYTACRKCFDKAFSLCRPLYYHYPEIEEAYTFDDEYFFGDDFIAAPVVCPLDGEQSPRTFFLPPGQWYDTAAGQMLTTGVYTRNYLLEEVPLFVRAGAVIPGQKNVSRLNGRSIENLLLTVYPGSAGTGELYDDDGISENYRTSPGIRLDFTNHRESDCRVINICRRANSGLFAEDKELFLRFPGVVPPEKITVNGRDIKWNYCGEKMEIEASAGKVDLNEPLEIRVFYREDNEFSPVDGCRGSLARLRIIAGYHNYLGGNYHENIDTRLGQELGHTGRRITLHPDKWRDELANLRRKLPLLKEEMIKTANFLYWEGESAEERMNYIQPALKLLDDIAANFS
ncbi:MAG: DUF4968 domain-containing protein [Lentisphaeria bacterium]|nr:DUF4968 domain-containing protein [Lentisphaeria bacterium]